jgi:hypothetical protein
MAKPSQAYSDAKVWLLDYMATSPRPIADLIEAAETAQAAGMNLKKLDNVAQRLNLVHEKLNGRWHVRWPKVRRPAKVRELEWAAAWLRGQLALGPRYADELWRSARDHDVLVYRYHQAAKILGVVQTKEEIPLEDGWMKTCWRWELPSG